MHPYQRGSLQVTSVKVCYSRRIGPYHRASRGRLLPARRLIGHRVGERLVRHHSQSCLLQLIYLAVSPTCPLSRTVSVLTPAPVKWCTSLQGLSLLLHFWRASCHDAVSSGPTGCQLVQQDTTIARPFRLDHAPLGSPCTGTSESTVRVTLPLKG